MDWMLHNACRKRSQGATREGGHSTPNDALQRNRMDLSENWGRKHMRGFERPLKTYEELSVSFFDQHLSDQGPSCSIA